MNRLVLLTISVICISACSSQRQSYSTSIQASLTKGCINSKKSTERKVQLENGIRGQVKFLGEPENVDAITNKMSEYKIPALSLAVIVQGKIEWADIYKNSDFPEQQELDCTSLFQAASLSKPVTFLAAVRMHSAGAIDLDTNIQSYLKDFVLPAGQQTPENPVTLRNIFSHTSGITPGGYQGYAKGLALPSDVDILAGSSGVNSPPIAVVAPPNETLAYSGGAYTLAELALQNKFEDEFPSIMKRWILDPAGMKHSDFTQPLPADKSSLIAKGYTQAGDVLDGGWRNHPEQAAAGLWSHSIDMAKLMIEVYKAYQGNSAIFSQSDIKSLISHERDGLVYGFIVDRSDDRLAITHYGGNAGYRTGMTIDLMTGNGLAYLSNSDNGARLGSELLLSAAQVYDWQHFNQTVVSRRQVNPKVLEKLPGEYNWNRQINLSVSYDRKDTDISLHFPNGDTYVLTPIAGDGLSFIHPRTGVKVTFIKEDGFQSLVLYGKKAVKLNVDS